MRFWDTSGVVPLLFQEARSTTVEALYRRDPSMVVWWATEVECCSAIGRWEREGKLAPAVSAAAFRRLGILREDWLEIDPAEELREVAKRFVRMHSLRAADALQLAAAYLASARQPSALEFVCLDARLSDAALREGFVLTSIPLL